MPRKAIPSVPLSPSQNRAAQSGRHSPHGSAAPSVIEISDSEEDPEEYSELVEDFQFVSLFDALTVPWLATDIRRDENNPETPQKITLYLPPGVSELFESAYCPKSRIMPRVTGIQE
ncbi:hypothetical protein NM688_g9083 [Phlebia brevispora]|uniref:Uncharacterized protein n=1 Tax=Phlebia brevispora TaxID=194682 RepID=A0ACC1RN51_9APHY|nr:hypothetical protein NM688_g9083 [Phlebia brevispora]